MPPRAQGCRVHQVRLQASPPLQRTPEPSTGITVAQMGVQRSRHNLLRRLSCISCTPRASRLFPVHPVHLVHYSLCIPCVPCASHGRAQRCDGGCCPRALTGLCGQRIQPSQPSPAPHPGIIQLSPASPASSGVPITRPRQGFSPLRSLCSLKPELIQLITPRPRQEPRIRAAAECQPARGSGWPRARGECGTAPATGLARARSRSCRQRLGRCIFTIGRRRQKGGDLPRDMKQTLSYCPGAAGVRI